MWPSLSLPPPPVGQNEARPALDRQWLQMAVHSGRRGGQVPGGTR